MVKKTIVLSLVVFAVFLFSLSSASAQAELVGKYVKINGPFQLSYLGIARTKQAYQLMDTALKLEKFENALRNFDIVIVKNNLPVCVLDLELFNQRAKVLVLEGLQEGITGWVPLSWLPKQPEEAKLWQNHRLH
ncbi:MAG: hypothetical protein K9L95_04385 [Candidatus Omnitrophica bacterium]|nr:hypothetical protein [Candidatus Omnitrophota bacterium]MCF7876976.1 hypothetical protein [Candidatus Omnitrophota bacterium]MCF7878691.1 hypothetical protein [Candidatus Omnitrophota bacterium]MCF7893055.1 hypothetical protein [Candidatus Omnitrophota bacterium]